MTGDGLIVESVCVRRGGRSVLEPLSFRLTAGETLAIIGPNGAGKTSLLEAVLGFLPLLSGRVSYEGRPLYSLRDRARVFSFLAEDAEPPAEVRVATLLRSAARESGARQRLTEALAERLGLKGVARAFAGELSRGEKRRVLLFGALCTDRPVIVLDEPLGVFDPLQMIDIRALLHERAAAGAALLLSVHQMAEAERIASRFLLLDSGRGVAFGSLAELGARVAQTDASLEDIFLALLRRGGDGVAA